MTCSAKSSKAHDIKTPLGVIELYAKALEKGLYKDEQKKLEVARNINGKCEEIRGYVDGIVKASSGDFLNLEVHNGEFYLSALISQIKAFYTDKLNLLKIDFSIESFSDCILSGDLERCVEVLQNIIENAVKYGNGKERTTVSSCISATAAVLSAKTSCRIFSTASGAAQIPEATAAAAWDFTSAAH